MYFQGSMQPPQVQKCCVQLEHMARTQIYFLCYRLCSHCGTKTRRPFNTPELDKNLCCKGKVTVLIHTSLFPTNCTMRPWRRADTTFMYGLSKTSASLISCSRKGLSRHVMGQKNAHLVLQIQHVSVAKRNHLQGVTSVI